MQTREDIENKLSQFGAIVMADAASERDALSASLRARREELIAKCENEARKSGAAAQKSAEEAARGKYTNTVSEATYRAKRALWDKREALTESLFAAVRQKLDAYMKTQEYKDCLLAALESAKAYGSDICVILRAEDKSFSELLLQKGAADVQTAPIIGGARFEIRDKRISLDMTFDAALREAREGFNKLW